MNTVITIQQTSRTMHEIKVKGVLSDTQMDMIAAKLERATHPDDMAGTIQCIGLEVMEVDTEGCWKGSNFEWIDDRQEDY